MRKRIFVATMLPISLMTHLGATAAIPAQAPVTVFLSACMAAKGSAESSRIAAEKLGLGPATEEQKARVMRRGATGDAYVAHDIVLVVERDRPICTVFANSEKPDDTRAQLAKMLPPASTPFNVSTEKVGDTSDQSTVMHRISLDGKPFATWTFSAYKRPGVFNVAMTSQMSRAR